jgi:uncharacterized protein YcaQ
MGVGESAAPVRDDDADAGADVGEDSGASSQGIRAPDTMAVSAIGRAAEGYGEASPQETRVPDTMAVSAIGRAAEGYGEASPQETRVPDTMAVSAIGRAAGGYGGSSPREITALSPDEVRRITLYAQGFLGAGAKRGGVTGMLRRVSAVQLDTISVLARSHELVAYARLGPVGRDAVERAYWPAQKPTTFEYWAHAACILPIADWPYYALRRRAIAARGQRWHKVSEDACERVLGRLRDEGPLTAAQLGGAKAGGPWWDWSEVKIAAEWLLDTGRAVCVRRIGWRRVYDLPERVIPKDLFEHQPTDKECLSYLVGTVSRALGVATHADFVEYQRLNYWLGLSVRSVAALDEAAAAAGLVPVTVPGTRPGGSGESSPRASSRPVPAWADPAALAWLDAGGRGTHRTTLLSPFDSLVWDRKRTLRMFGHRLLFEPYVPKEKRERGYFTMPLLAGGKIVGWVDPGRDGKTLLAKNLFLEKPAAVAPMARALAEAAQWVDCANVATERVRPAVLAQPLASELRALGV